MEQGLNVYRKHRKISLSKVIKSSKSEQLELIHADVYKDNHSYNLLVALIIFTFTDDATRNCRYISWSINRMCFDIFKKLKATVENERFKEEVSEIRQEG
jgi:hypothetical protein